MVFLTSAAECFFRPFHDVENSFGYPLPIKSAVRKNFTFTVLRFKGLGQLSRMFNPRLYSIDLFILFLCRPPTP